MEADETMLPFASRAGTWQGRCPGGNVSLPEVTPPTPAEN
jgi:hypothetical protein